MMLLGALDAFYLERRECGELAGDVEGEHVWMTCSCGAVLFRQIAQEYER